jgi:hypothetical protein
MAKRLAKTVMVRDPETDQYKTYAAGTIPPASVAKEITNPMAWGETAEGKPKSRGRKVPKSDEFGTGPFSERTDEQLLGLARRYGVEAETVDEALAALDAEGVNPDDAPPPTSGDTNVDGI